MIRVTWIDGKKCNEEKFFFVFEQKEEKFFFVKKKKKKKKIFCILLLIVCNQIDYNHYHFLVQTKNKTRNRFDWITIK